MASIYGLKPKFQSLLRPLSNQLARCGVTANQVTLAALLLSLLTGCALAMFPTSRWALYAIPIVLFIRMILNAIDGMLAREHNMQSALGTFLNELGDVLSDTFLYLPFAVVGGAIPRLVIFIIFLALISEMTGVIAIQAGANRRYDGPMGKSDRAFAFSLLAILLAAGVQPGLWVNVFLAIIAGLLIYTIINRITQALRVIHA